MKWILFTLLTVFLFTVSTAHAAPIKCDTIPKDNLLYSNGIDILHTGPDIWGYNYQAHGFNGFLPNTYQPVPMTMEGDHLQLKWNDAWLSNKDCDGDNFLDRHYGHANYIGSGAKMNAKVRGNYISNNETCTWSHSTSIRALPAGTNLLQNGDWYDSNREYLGKQIWGNFYIASENVHDPCGGQILFSLETALPWFGNI